MGAFGRQNEFSFLGIIPRNVISENNFLEHDILGVFGVQIEFLRIFNKFSKILLMEVAAGGDGNRWWWIVIDDKWLCVVNGVFWSFHYGKYSLPIGMLDSHRWWECFGSDFPSQECHFKPPTNYENIFTFLGIKKNYTPIPNARIGFHKFRHVENDGVNVLILSSSSFPLRSSIARWWVA